MATSGNPLTLTNNTEIVEKKVDIENALSRFRRPLESTTVNVEVYGEDPNEQQYQYELEVCGISIKNAKAFPRELTEEEKAEQEAAKNTKPGQKAPAKDPKKKEEEPSAAEIERIEREKKEKEERQRKLQEEWDALDEETKFFRKNEDMFKEPSIKFQNHYAQKKIQELQTQLNAVDENDEQQKRELQMTIQELQKRTWVGHAQCTKQSYELVELEEIIAKEGGAWLKFNRQPPPEEEVTDPKAKKAAPAKGKGAPAEDLKPTFGRAWIDFSDLKEPGSLEVKKRVFLETCTPLVKKQEADGTEQLVEAEEFDKIFEPSQTYAYIKITFSEPVTPTIPEKPEPQMHEVVPVKQFIRWPYSKDPSDDFAKQITLAIESLAKEYYNMFQNELLMEAQGGKSQQEQNEAFEERKKEFLYEINTQGKYHILKEKLKKTIVRIVKEHFKKQGSIRGLHKDERDHFYSELYAFLVSQMKKAVQQLVERKKNELHENITIPKDQAERERDLFVQKNINETVNDRYKRLCNEAENLTFNFQEASGYMKKLMSQAEGDSAALLQMGRFFARNKKLEKADEYYRDALSFSMKNPNLILIYASYLVSMSRSSEAIILLQKLASDNYQSVKVNMLTSIAYELDGDQLMAEKYKSIACIQRMRELGYIEESGNLKDHQPKSQPPVKLQPGQSAQQEETQFKQQGINGYQNKRLSKDEENEIYLEIAEFLVQENFSQFANKAISFVENKESSRYLNISSKLQMQLGQFDSAIESLVTILDQDQTNLEATILVGHCHYLKNLNAKEKDFSQAIEYYCSAIRLASFKQISVPDEFLYQRLGQLYLQDQQWKEAKVMFEVAVRENKTAFGFFNLGVANYWSGDYDTATYLFSQANYLDPMKADTWGYLTLALLKNSSGNVNSAFQAMKEALKLEIKNIDILEAIAEEWKKLGKEDHVSVIIDQLKRAKLVSQKGNKGGKKNTL